MPQHRATSRSSAHRDERRTTRALYNDLGCLVAWDGFWRDALRKFETAAKLDKGDTRPLYNAGLVHALQGRVGERAQRSFHKAVKRGPGNWAGWWMLGFAEEQLGNDARRGRRLQDVAPVDTSLFDVKQNPFAAQHAPEGARPPRDVRHAARARRHPAGGAVRGARPRDLVPARHVAVTAVRGAPRRPRPEERRRATGSRRHDRAVRCLGRAAAEQRRRHRRVAAPARPAAPTAAPTGAEPAEQRVERFPPDGRPGRSGRPDHAPCAGRRARTAPGAPQTSPARRPPAAPTAVVPGPGTGA